jgi:SPP1 family predicted phage head-tail adaptor
MAIKQTTIDEMNKRISLQSFTLTKSDSGHSTRVYNTPAYATVWARSRTIGGQEKLNAGRVTGTLTIEFTIRYSSEVSVLKVYHRVLMGSRTFDIKDVRNVDERNIEIRMLATEVE